MAAGGPYAIGLDLGFLLLKGYNSRADEIVQIYDKQFDPTLDVWLRPIDPRKRGMTLRFMPSHAGVPRKRGA
jgi:hypothetical protein